MKKLLFIALLAIGCSKSKDTATPKITDLSGQWEATAVFTKRLTTETTTGSIYVIKEIGSISTFDLTFNEDGTGTISGYEVKGNISYHFTGNQFSMNMTSGQQDEVFSTVMQSGTVLGKSESSFNFRNEFANVNFNKKQQ